MKIKHTSLVLIAASMACFAQTAPVDDPVSNAASVPAKNKLLPGTAPEPWQKITPRENFNHFVSMTFSPGAFIGYAAGAAIDQGINSPKEWGQGWDAYGKRFASSFGSTVVGNTIQYGTSFVFHDDNRYFRTSGKSFGARLGNVIISPLVAHNDRGGRRFSTSAFLGGAAASTIPLAWSPRSWQGGSEIALNGAIWYGETAGINFVREFFPSISKHLRDGK
jgi:hypothetical protein